MVLGAKICNFLEGRASGAAAGVWGEAAMAEGGAPEKLYYLAYML